MSIYESFWDYISFEYEHNVIWAVKLSIADCISSCGPDLIHTFNGQKKVSKKQTPADQVMLSIIKLHSVKGNCQQNKMPGKVKNTKSAMHF